MDKEGKRLTVPRDKTLYPSPVVIESKNNLQKIEKKIKICYP